MTVNRIFLSALVFALAFVAGGAAARGMEPDLSGVEKLFELVNGAIIIAIMGITTIIRHVGGHSMARWIPLVPMLLGAVCGYLVAHESMSVRQVLTWALLYSGAASVGYMFIWKTIMKKGLGKDGD